MGKNSGNSKGRVMIFVLCTSPERPLSTTGKNEVNISYNIGYYTPERITI